MDTKFINPLPIIDVAQDVTASFVDLGAEQDMRGFTKLGLFLNVEINDSENIRIQAIGKTEAGGSIDYLLPIKSVSFSNGAVGFKTFFIELAADVDQGIIIETETGNIVPFVQLQVMAGTVGATAGKILNALVSKSFT